MKSIFYLFLFFFLLGIAGDSPFTYLELALVSGAWTIGITALAVILRKFKLI